MTKASWNRSSRRDCSCSSLADFFATVSLNKCEIGTMSLPNSFETERLVLRPTSIEDAQFIFELMNSPKWLAYIGDRGVNSKEDAEEYIKARMLPQFERLGYGNYTVTRKEDDHQLGTCGLYDREGLEGVDIGFAFLPGFENQGYGYESASLLRDAAFSKFGLKKLNAITVMENFASQKLLEKLGLEFVELIKLEGDDEKLMFYQMIMRK